MEAAEVVVGHRERRRRAEADQERPDRAAGQGRQGPRPKRRGADRGHEQRRAQRQHDQRLEAEDGPQPARERAIPDAEPTPAWRTWLQIR